MGELCDRIEIGWTCCILCCEVNTGNKRSLIQQRQKLLTCFTNSLFRKYINLSLKETEPEVYNMGACPESLRNPKEGLTLVKCLQYGLFAGLIRI